MLVDENCPTNMYKSVYLSRNSDMMNGGDSAYADPPVRSSDMFHSKSAANLMRASAAKAATSVASDERTNASTKGSILVPPKRQSEVLAKA